MKSVAACGVLTLLWVSTVVRSQPPQFELVQKELFSAGGAFVNAWADPDADGDLDLFVGFDGEPNRLYRNDGGTFVDAAATAGIADARATRASAWGDADADGDVDLLVGFTPGDGSVLRFYRNTGGRFRDDTAASGLGVATGAVRQPVWVDFDADGDLDLFVAFRDRPNAMFRQEDRQYRDVASEIGLADTRRTVGAVWFDLEGDGDLDLVTGNMDGDANGVFVQERGTFVDVAEGAGLVWGGRTPRDKSHGTVRPCAADIDSDGRLDLFFANYGSNGLFLNRGGSKFEDVSSSWGIAIDGRYDSCAFADIDNDGDLDLYVNGTVTGGTQYPDYLFRNTGKRFEAITPPELGSPNSDHGVQWADFDRDGAIDLALTGVQKDGMHWLLRNRLPVAEAARGFSLDLRDADDRALTAGTVVTVQVLGKTTKSPRQTRLIDAGSGYNSQSTLPLHLAAGGTDPRVTLAIEVHRAGERPLSLRHDVDTAKLRGQAYQLRLR